MTWDVVITRWRSSLHQAETLFESEDWDGLSTMSWQVPGGALTAHPTSAEVEELRALRSRSDALQERVVHRLSDLSGQIDTEATRRLAARAYVASDVL